MQIMSMHPTQSLDSPFPFRFSKKPTISETPDCPQIIGKKRSRQEEEEGEESDNTFVPLKKKYKQVHLYVNTNPQNLHLILSDEYPSNTHVPNDYNPDESEDDATVDLKEKLDLFERHQEYIRAIKRFNKISKTMKNELGSVEKLEIPTTCYQYKRLKREVELLDGGYRSPKNVWENAKMLDEYDKKIIPLIK